MPSVKRILDADANRAREALRVMEDAARFLLDDAELSAAVKELRHDLAGALARVPGLEVNRDTPGDVGVTIKTERELVRGSAAEVAIAAGKRLSEALRALEEFGKTLPGDGECPAAIEKLRYRGYEVERRLNLALGAGRPGRQWKLCVLVSAELCLRGDWLGVAAAALAGGADCLQLREKALPGGELLTRAKQLAPLCRRHGASLIVNDHADIALLSGADGVHLGQTDLPCAEVRRLVGRQLLIGVSTGDLTQARRAVGDGADYCGVGCMFPSGTKHKDTIAGPAYLRQFASEFPALPHLAIGGIDAGNIAELIAAGARGVAVSSAVCAAADPRAAAAVLRGALDAAAV
jgi:thiamine-phosphate pyrophosphorylase